MVQLSYSYMTTGKTIALTIWTFVSKVISLFLIKVRKIKTELVLVLGLCMKRDCWLKENTTWEMFSLIMYVPTWIILENSHIFYPLYIYFSLKVYYFFSVTILIYVPNPKLEKSTKLSGKNNWIWVNSSWSHYQLSISCIYSSIHPSIYPASK